MKKLLKMINDTRVDMRVFSDELGLIHVNFQKNGMGLRRVFDPEINFSSGITMEDQIIFALNDFLESLE